jgi:amino-acid N-acetyltransferase
MTTRRARAADAAAIDRLIAHYAGEGLLLPRDFAEIRANIRHFLLLENAGKFAGCVALEPYGTDLAEIRSLALVPGARGQGLGRRLIESALAEAKRRGIARVFAVTHAPSFFLRNGFQSRKRQLPPEKVERDCKQCPKALTCRLVAVVADVLPERGVLHVLDPAAAVPVTA